MKGPKTVDSQKELLAAFTSLQTHITLLTVAGLGGAIFRALVAPKESWKLRVTQGLGGALSAIFLGGFMAQATETIFMAGPYAWLAWGFIMGSGGEVAVKFVQDKLIGVKKDG